MDWEKVVLILAEMDRLFVQLDTECENGEMAENQFDDCDEIISEFCSMVWFASQSLGEMKEFVKKEIDSSMWRKEA